MPRKRSAIRQFSLQCETPPSSATTRRASLKKQHSEEVGDVDVGIRISLSAKAALRNPKPPIKIAWGDDEPATRPAQPFRRHSHHQTTDEAGGGGVGGKAALYSRQDLAQKLHLAWQDRENTKNKLNIFLAHNFQPEPGEEPATPRQLVQNNAEPKIMQPLLPQYRCNENHPSDTNINLKQIFQKHLRKSRISSPVGSDSETASHAVVVVPIIERSKPTTKDIKNRPQTAATATSTGSTSAAQKRAMFQKRTNSAFQSMTSACSSPMPPPPSAPRLFRPPMVRASSLPAASKPPDIQVKPRLRKKIKVYKRGKSHAGKDNDDDKKNSDVVTMVSLVSASESEAEDSDIKELKDDAKPPPANSNQQHSPKKTTPANEKHFSLRKTVKQVSFQHSSIHAVRSFSASFPARRASVGANLLLDSAAKKLQKSLEKRGQPDDGLADAKRRLLQPNTQANSNSHNHQNNAEGDESARSTKTIAPETPRQDQESTPPSADHMRSNGGANKENQDGGETHKERKCWETYCRMTKSGLNVSFDTILRGMLTPTEYRLRRRLSLQQAEEEPEQCANQNSMAKETNTSNANEE